MSTLITGKKAVIAGATGLVGSALLRRLLADERYAQVTAITRRPLALAHPKLLNRVVDFDRLAYADEAHDWFCTLGTTIKQAGSQAAFRIVDHDYPIALGRLAIAHGAERFLVITAMGASADSGIFYNRVKGETERDLQALGLPALLVFRPSLLLGERAHFRLGERIGAAVMKAAGPLMVGPLRKYRAVRGDTVAAAMIAAAHASPAVQGTAIYENDRLPELAAKGAHNT